MSVSVDILKVASMILLAVQGVKKLPFLRMLLDKNVYVAIALTVLVTFLAGFLEYGGDGVIQVSEAFEILSAMVIAMGGHFGLVHAETSVVKRGS